MDKTSGCSPLGIRFTNLSNTGPNIQYEWDFGNGNSSVLQNPFAIYLEEKVYTVTLTVRSGTQTATKTRTITVYKKPVVDFSVIKPKVCLPEGVQLNSLATSGDGTIANYQWDFGDGFTQAGFSNSMSHFYTVPMIPAVSLTVTNSFGCMSSATKTNLVEILPKIEPLFAVNKTLLCDLSDSIQLTNNSTGPGTLLYSWDFGDGTTSTLKNPTHRYATKDVYQVRLTVSNTVGCSVTSSSIAVNAAYFQTNFSSQLLCRQVNFSGSSFLFPSSSVWKFGDLGTSTLYPSTTHTYAAAGSYDVTLINTYNNTCKDTITKTIAVQSLVSFNSNVTVPAATCKGSTVSMTVTSSVAPNSINWNFGDGSSFITTSTNVSHIYQKAGTYTVTVVNTFGTCSETVTKTIVVNEAPTTDGFVADFGGVCGAPVTVTFRDTSAGNVGWQWYMDWTFNPAFSSLQNAPYLFPSNGTHNVYLTVSNAAGCTKTIWKPLTVTTPAASIYVSQSSSPKAIYDCDSLTVRFGVNANQPIRSYSWDLGNGQTSTLASPQARYTAVGVYNVILTYTTESGCIGTAMFSPRVYDKPKANFVYSVPCGNSLDLNFSDISPFSDGWTWIFGDGGVAYWNNPNHVYPDTGKYNMTFINQVGHCSDTVKKVVYANKLPSSISIVKSANTCTGNRATVSFDQRSVRCSGGTWDFGDGTILPFDSSNHNVIHTYTATGTYQVKLTSGYDGCTYTATRTVNVLLKQNPVLTANQTQICASNSLNVQIGNLQTNPFTSSVTWGQYYVQQFEHNNGIAFNGFVNSQGFQLTSYAATLQNFTAGTTSLRAIIAEGNTGCFDTTNYITLQVNGPIAGFKVANNNGCYKTAMIFTDTSRSATNVALTSWQWDFGDGVVVNNATNATVSHRYNNPGSYTVRLTVKDATGCSKTVSSQVAARGPKAAFTVSGLFVPNVPLNTTVNFFNNTTSFSNSVDYKWVYGDGATSTNYSGSHTYTVAGVYTVLLIATDPSISCSDTATQVITVKDFNTAFSFSRSFLGGTSCPPVLVRINNLSVGYTRLLWDFGDGTTSTQSFPSHTYTSAGRYIIKLFTYGFNGLTGTYIDSLDIISPLAQINADVLQGCQSQQVNFGMTSQNAASHLWDFGDGNNSTSSAGTMHQYLSAGIYNPRLIIKDSNGCQVSARLADSVVIDNLSIAINGIPPLVCDSAQISFVADVKSFAETKLNAPLQYKWNFGTGNAADTSAQRNPVFRFTTPGTYTITLRVTSPYGCVRDTFATVVVQQKAKGKITAVTESCEQLTVAFNGTATTSTSVQWSWTFGNGNTSTVPNPPAQLYNTPGNYTIMLLVTKNGCIDTSIHQLTVYPKPLVNASPREKILCLGDSIQLNSSGGGSYSWSPAIGLSNASIASPYAKPTTSTLYRVQVVSDKGCINRDSINITVAQPIKVSLPTAVSVCLGTATQLTASGATTYQWINNTAGLSNTGIANPMAASTTTTTYTVVGFDQYGCFKDTALTSVTVHNLPTVIAGPDVETIGGTPYQLSAAASVDVVNWQWSPADYLSCATCASPIATPKMETAYVVTVANQWNCAAKDTVLLKLQCAIGHVYIPDAFTPNNDGKNDLFYISGSGLKIIRHLRIYDRWGGVMFERRNFGLDDKSSGWDGKVNGQPVAGGTYVYVSEMECSSGELFVRKGTVTLIR